MEWRRTLCSVASLKLHGVGWTVLLAHRGRPMNASMSCNQTDELRE